MELASRILSDVTTFQKYAKHLPAQERREVYSEVIDRNRAMHLARFPSLTQEIDEAYRIVYARDGLPSMRALQFSGKPIEINNARGYNCCFLPMEHYAAFAELMFLLLSGCGVGYSVQRHHVEKLPPITKPTKRRRYLVGDSIEGWADAVKALMKAYFFGRAVPDFDFRDIRTKGAPLLTSGGKAPGPEPLKECLFKMQQVLDRKENGDQLSPIEVHDINCHIAHAVLAGGIRRSAMIALFDMTDEDMLTCKFPASLEQNPQRHRANNTAVILRHRIKKREFLKLWEKIKASGTGEPGFFFTNDKEWGLNPCAEISLRAYQFCNLGEINASTIRDQADLDERARMVARICTLQASYTDFHYLRPIWKQTTEREALIGVGMTGIASGTVLGLDLTQAAEIVKEENARVAAIIGIKAAARCTTVKPSGTTSCVLGTSSGIHAWHDLYYLRRQKVGKNEALYTYLTINAPDLLEDDFFAPTKSAFVVVPQKAPEGAITRAESALDLLHRVSKVWREWVLPGHRAGANYNNVSTTVTIKDDEWDDVGDWMWANREHFTALSVFPYDNTHYVQTPFESCTKAEYERRMKSLVTVDLTQVVELMDNTDLQGEVACGAGGCEIV
jgi:ribonucleoside-triphosphate reductase